VQRTLAFGAKKSSAVQQKKTLNPVIFAAAMTDITLQHPLIQTKW